MKKIFLFSSFCIIFIPLLYPSTGFLGTTCTNPFPILIDGQTTDIELCYEEITLLIQRDFVYYVDWNIQSFEGDLTADFIFINSGDSQAVRMAIPIEVHQPLSPYLTVPYDSTYQVKFPQLRIDGLPKEAELLYCTKIRENTFWYVSWDSLKMILDPLSEDQPDSGQYLYYRNYPPTDLVPYFPTDAALACWEVNFKPGESHLIEYNLNCKMNHDDSSIYRLTYPLQTVSNWISDTNQIKFTVLIENSVTLANLNFYYGIGLPQPTIYEDYFYKIPEQISNYVEPEKTNLSKYDQTNYYSALIWELKNFTPSISDLSYKSFYPDLGDFDNEYYTLYDQLKQAHRNFEEVGYLPWLQNMVYLYFAPTPVSQYFVVPSCGAALFDSPYGEPTSIRISPLSSVKMIEQQDSWIYGEIIDHLNNEKYIGWLPIFELDSQNLVQPVLMPYIF